MKKITCTIRFITPAFLGDANQNGAWRVPPFKAELRQWWRIVMASKGETLEAIRSEEAALFGVAADKRTCKSKIRLALSRWDSGRLHTPPDIGSIGRGRKTTNLGQYLGYGAPLYDKNNQSPNKCAIDANETAELSLAIHPQASDSAEALFQALALMSRYGTVGGRSRNAWGSFIFESDDIPSADTCGALIKLDQALNMDWAAGIGTDRKGPLIWSTGTHNKWQPVMADLAQLRKQLNGNSQSKAKRALLSYPVSPELSEWKNIDKARLPNSLRFKVVKNENQFQGLAFHMPCKPEKSLCDKHPFANHPEQLLKFWQCVHQELDSRYKNRVSA